VVPPLLAAALLVAALPSPGRAETAQRKGFDPWAGGKGPAERALTGGVTTLRAPASTMIRVPKSTFFMGSTPTEVLEAVLECTHEPLGDRMRCNEMLFSNELARHKVTLSAYWLDRTEVTVRAYQRCVALHRCRPVPYSRGATRFDRPHFPVSLVTWQDARDYCRFRGGRLPTEAEWERAARGVTGRRFPWGNLYNSHVSNHGRLGQSPADAGDGYAELAPVGSFPSGRTPDGFLDMAGNVSEWVNDRYADSYPEARAVDPRGPKTNAGGERVIRGGSYQSGVPWLRGTVRLAADPGVRRPWIGFRCARTDKRHAPIPATHPAPP